MGFCFATLLFSTVATADIVTDFKNSVKVLPRALLGKGYSRIGNIELEPFMERAERMTVRDVGTVRHKQNLDGGIQMERNLAEWRRTSTGAVAIGGALWAKTPAEVRPLVALHESLGALGYSDDILSCSGALYILANDGARSTLNSGDLARIERIAERSCVVAGGTTGVTGGGDDYIARVRIKSLKNTLNAIHAGKDRAQATSDMESSLFVAFEHNRSFKREDSIFSRNYKHTKECLDSSRGIADESSIRVAYQGQAVPYDARNGWTFDKSTNCILFHGSAVHGWAGTSVLWSRKR